MFTQTGLSIQGTSDTKGEGCSSPPSSDLSFSTFCALAYGLDLRKRTTSLCKLHMHIQGEDLRDSGRWVRALALLRSHKQINGLKRAARSELRSMSWSLCSSSSTQLWSYKFLLFSQFHCYLQNSLANLAENGATISSVQETLLFSECHFPRSTNRSPGKETDSHERQDEVMLALDKRQKPGLPVLALERANILWHWFRAKKPSQVLWSVF